MGVTKSRVSQVERGEVSTIEVVARYVQAIGGQIQISAVFGDDHLPCPQRHRTSRRTAIRNLASQMVAAELRYDAKYPRTDFGCVVAGSMAAHNG
jgi:hypothetical protein